MSKRWAEDFHDADDLAPREGDEELFLSILLAGGVEALRVQYGMRGYCDAYVVERFCKEHHRLGGSAMRGSWVRYQIWRDKHRELTAPRK